MAPEDTLQALYGVGGAASEAIAYLKAASPAWISDAQAVTNTMGPEIRPVWSGARAVGPAYTARCYPGSIITVHKALLEAPAGAVLVVDESGGGAGAMFGELMGTEAKARGLAGIVVDGLVRDGEGLRDLPFPAFARGLVPRVGSNRRVGTTQVDVVCGGVVVHPWDLVIGAHDGVVIIPHGRFAEVVAAVQAVEQKEAGIRARMDQGERLADILNMTGVIYPDGSRP
jgi:4-hydroxy-4-methyl-2-oxoglutarate aldolase